MSILDYVDGVPRADWLAARRTGIGASEAAAIFGMHPWLSPLGLYLDKTGELTRDAEPPTEAMEWGIRLEEVVAEAWAEKNDRIIDRRDKTMLRHPDHPWMLCNLDRRVPPDAVLEVKTVSGWAVEDWRDDELPPHVIIQVHWQLAVTGYQMAHVAALLGGHHYVQRDVPRDEAFVELLIAEGAKFWSRVITRDEPAADSHPNTSAVLRERWQQTLDEAVELGEEGYELVTARHTANAALKAAQQDKDGAENRLRQLMGENEVGLVHGEIACTWRPDKNGKRTLRVKELV